MDFRSKVENRNLANTLKKIKNQNHVQIQNRLASNLESRIRPLWIYNYQSINRRVDGCLIVFRNKIGMDSLFSRRGGQPTTQHIGLSSA